jgi:glucose/arabinose dehydrogenase
MKFNLFICILFFSSFSYSSYQYETVLDELDDAWSFVFLSEDKILYTEMPGALKVASLDDKSIVEISNVPKVQYVSQGGLVRSNFRPKLY